MYKYKFIFFDLDNTLWDFTANSRVAIKNALDDLGILPLTEPFDDFFTIYQEINEGYWVKYRNKEITKKQLSSSRFKDSLHAFGINNNDIDGEEINRLFLEHLKKQKILFPGTLNLLNKIFPHIQLYIITNGFKEVQREKITHSGLAPFFQKIFISEEVNAHKPSREIFDYAIKSANAKKLQSLMVGDSWEADIVGAQNANIDQVFFAPHLKLESSEMTQFGKNTTYKISRFDQLVNVLCKKI